ncbi:MAG: hypothetical protein EZS28_025616 [Streblomastix strix]|uniref:Uncharacterized protein n=1 Tax=Streblomastix strix TaxID=222440 RepID=A0A5J4V8M2_9EUKA|nr:MAG: hypothetical protein EZS28_025616 [Streblomastix strix]
MIFAHNYVGVEEQCVLIGLIDNLDGYRLPYVQNHGLSKSKATTVRLVRWGKNKIGAGLLKVGQEFLESSSSFIALCKAFADFRAFALSLNLMI